MSSLCAGPLILRGIRLFLTGRNAFTFLAVLLYLLLPWALTKAQETTGAITGVVTDNSQAVIVGAKVTAVNIATGVPTTTVTNSSGNYALHYLISGTYSLTVDYPGFAKTTRSGFEVRLGDDLKVDVTLAVESSAQTISVEGKTPLIDATHANMGDTINREEIQELPLSDGNAFLLTQLVPGVNYTGNPQFTRPFDNSDVSGIRVNGAESSNGNEFTINGLSDTGVQSAGSTRVVAYVPPQDAVQEFKMTTSNFSAEYGHSVGSSIDVTTRSGTNALHGSAYEYFRNELTSANQFFENQAGRPQPKIRYNRFGGSLGGPVIIPKLYNGHNKTFFFVAGEGLLDAFPEPGKFTVPTQAMRNGDFSALLAANPNDNIYDPLTAKPCGPGNPVLPACVVGGPTVSRQPFPGNIIPADRISPIAKAVLNFYPLPNNPGTDAIGTDNFLSDQTRTDKYYTYFARIDHTISTRQQLSLSNYYGFREEKRFHWAPPVNGVDASGQDLFRTNYGLALDHVLTLSSSTLLDIRAGATRFVNLTAPPTAGFDPATLGFSPSVVGQMLGVQGQLYAPPFNINQFTRLSHNTGGTLWLPLTSDVISLEPTLTKLIRSHSLNFGYDFRVYREYDQALGDGAGVYTFNQDFTRQTSSGGNFTCDPNAKKNPCKPVSGGTPPPFSTLGNQSGQSLAAFLLGQPTGGGIDRNVTRANQVIDHGFFVQDNWKALPRLTLNLGLRYDIEGPTSERFDRNVRGFDFNTPNPIAAQAIANFAKILAKAGGSIPTEPGQPPITSIGQILGGFLFADPNHHALWGRDWLNLQPRFGAAYQLTNSTILRGGWAIYSTPWAVAGINQTGFSQNTQLVPSNDNGLTLTANLANPFPNGILPLNTSPNMTAGVGGNISIFPTQPKTQHTQRWAFDIQRELPGAWLVDAGYVGSYGYNLDRTSNFLNAIPPGFLSSSSIHDPNVDAFENATIPNPFIGLLPHSGSALNTNKSITPSQLVRAFPEFQTISSHLFDGSNYYHAGELRVQHRFKRGYAVFAAYTWSKLTERFGFLNDFQTEPTKRLAGNDVPQRLAVAAVAQLPFGHGRLLGSNWHGVLEQVLGGWQASGIYQIQSGDPISLGNIVFFGDPKQLRTHINSGAVGANQPVFDISQFYFSDAAVRDPVTGVILPTLQRADPRIKLLDNIRTLPAVLGNFRTTGQNNTDLMLSKRFYLRETTALEFRAQALNAFNHPWFNAPNVDPTSGNFGLITSQRNLSRELELALRLSF